LNISLVNTLFRLVAAFSTVCMNSLLLLPAWDIFCTRYYYYKVLKLGFLTSIKINTVTVQIPWYRVQLRCRREFWWLVD